MSFLKSFFTLFLISSLLFIALSVNQSADLAFKKRQLHFVPKEQMNEDTKERDRPDLAFQQEFELTKDPVLGTVPRERLYEAYLYAQKIRSASNKNNAAISGVQWRERGPNNCGGRTRAILIDPNDAAKRTVFAAGVSGGLWKTTDITQTSPNWTSINDFFDNLAVTSIFADPSNAQIMYFCTGEGYGNIDSQRGLGVWKSTNGGTTWAPLASTQNANFYFCQKILVGASGVVLVCTSTGLRRSADGGLTWTKVLGTGLGITGATSNNAYDIEAAANGDLYASLDGSIHKSINNGAAWSAAQTLPIAAGRVELACAPSDANYVYGLVESGNVIGGIILTTNGGTTWLSKTEPDDADPGIPATDFSRTQAWYDLCIAVSPTNRNELFVGGVDLFKSVNNGDSWQQISHWYGGFSFQNVHADQHILLFEPGSANVIYFGNDGGIWRSTNASAAIPTINAKHNNYNVTQFYACDIFPTAATNYFLAGAQDNGSHKFTSPGISATTEVTGGDGAYCHIDQNEPTYQFTAYVYNDFYRSNDCGATFTNFTFTGGDFISATDYDDVANIMYCANGNGTYRRWTNPQTGSTSAAVTIAAFNAGSVTCINANTNTANRVFFGLDNGRVVRVDNANTGNVGTHINNVAGMPTGSVSCVAVEAGNDNHIIITYSNYGVNSIWETTNGGTAWTSVEGNLPDMPLRWALFNPSNNAQVMIATELGVWTTDLLNGASTVWGTSNSGLANTRVTMLKRRTSDNMIIASTHGRGLFSSDAFMNPTASLHADTRTSYTNKTLQFFDVSAKASSWDWNFGDMGTSTLQNPTHAYTTGGSYNVTLSINGGTSTQTKNNYIQILPDRATPYTLTGGGNFESNASDFISENLSIGTSPCVATSGTTFERGNSAIAGKNNTVSGTNAWVTGLTAAAYTNNAHAMLYTSSYDFSATGTYVLNFQAKYALENQYDGFIVEYSTDKGTNWALLGTQQAGWYNYTNVSGTNAFPSGSPFFTGTQAAYGLKSLNVSFLSGNSSVAFRFVFKTDEAVTGVGIAIDDFEITKVIPAGIVVDALYGIWVNDESTELIWDVNENAQIEKFALERSSDGSNYCKLPQN